MTKKSMTSIARLFGLTALGGIFLAIGCESVEPGQREAVDTVEQAADGCGSGRQKGTVSQTCSYTPFIFANLTVSSTNAACDGDSKLNCTYVSADNCFWQATSAPNACKSGQPACPVLAAPTQPSTTVTLTLPVGETVCDPPGAASDLERYCRNHIPGGTANTLRNQCLSQTTPARTQDVQCCVNSPPPTGAGGAGGSGASGSTATGVGGASSSADTGVGGGSTTTSSASSSGTGEGGSFSTSASSSADTGAGGASSSSTGPELDAGVMF